MESFKKLILSERMKYDFNDMFPNWKTHINVMPIGSWCKRSASESASECQIPKNVTKIFLGQYSVIFYRNQEMLVLFCE